MADPVKGNQERTASAPWSATTKLVVGLTLVTITGFLLVRFRDVIGPLLFAFVLAYLFRPIANAMVNRLRLSWRGSVNIIYVLFLVVIIAFFTVTGVALVGQVNNLIRLLTGFVNDLPTIVEELTTSDQVLTVPVSGQQIVLSEFFANQNIDLLALAEQALGMLQPVLGQAGGVVGTVATSAVGVVGWAFFILFTSYFILSEAGQFPELLSEVDLPGHAQDLERLARELNRIWNAYLRGQLLLSFLVGFSYFLILLALGVRNALALGVLAGISRFVPYVGQWVTSGTIAVTAFLQSSNYIGLQPMTYAITVTVVILVIDQFVDGIMGPRIFSSALGVHPAALLVMAIVAASLFGFIGLILAAPVLASLQLFLRYVLRKMVDLDPWPEPEPQDENFIAAIAALPRDVWRWLRNHLPRRTPNDER